MRPKKNKPPLKLLPAPSLLRSGPRIVALSVWLRFKRNASSRHWLAIGAGVYLVLSLAFTASFFWPRSVNFSFAEETCFTSPTLLPDLIGKNQGRQFTATPVNTLAIADFPIYSQTTCLSPVQAPDANSIDNISFNPLGIGLLEKTIRVSTGKFPSVNPQTVLNKPVATQDPLVFRLSSADRFFSYQLVVGDKKAACDKKADSVVCSVEPLGLKQSTSYNFVLERLFKGKMHQVLFEKTASTVGAVKLSKSSISNNQIVYNAPGKISLAFSKEIATFEGVELTMVSKNGRKTVGIKTTKSGKTLTLSLEKPLDRTATFELTVKSIIAPDGGHLPGTLKLLFKTSGGPKVRWANIGSYKVYTSSNIVLTFDSVVSGSQNLNKFIKLEIRGRSVAANLRRSGKTVIINPASNLPRCTSFSVKVRSGLQNEHGISGGSAWAYNSRTICQTVFSIGTSLRGRGITAYRFGSGSSVIVFVGGTHGNEKSSTYTLNSWIDYLERNFHSLPSRRSIVVIPNLNPDGFALGSRTNARNVDLNRNFPADNWKKGVTMPGGTYNPNGGGSKPLSEPESKALANYVLGLNPRLVLTYHAAAGVVIPNTSGDSDALAKIYDKKSNLYYEPFNQTGNIFEYDTTGAFEDWLHDKPGIPALLIELWTMSGNEFSRNQNAMWHMANLR